MHGQQVHDALTEPQKKYAVVDRLVSPLVCWISPARVVQKDQIEIGAVAEFQTAEFAVAGHRDRGGAQRAGRIAAGRRAVGAP